MDVSPDVEVAAVAGAIAEPARARMLYCLLDGRARTSTELSIVAGVTPSTASVHLDRLRDAHLITVLVQGKHRYNSLAGPKVARALEALSVIAAGRRDAFVPNTPVELRAARTCYDHIAGRLGVTLCVRFRRLGWLTGTGTSYELSPKGMKAMAAFGIDVAAVRALRRKFLYPCLDWSERQPHLGGALASALLTTALKAKWVVRDADSRSLEVTRAGRDAIYRHFGVEWS